MNPRHDKSKQLARAASLITAHRKFPSEILVYKRNTAPLFRQRFWSSSSISRDPQLNAKTIRRQATRSGWSVERAPETLRETDVVRPAVSGEGSVRWCRTRL